MVDETYDKYKPFLLFLVIAVFFFVGAAFGPDLEFDLDDVTSRIELAR